MKELQKEILDLMLNLAHNNINYKYASKKLIKLIKEYDNKTYVFTITGEDLELVVTRTLDKKNRI